MSETYVECLVKRKPNLVLKFTQVLMTMLAVVFILLGMSLWPAMIIGGLLALCAYMIYLHADIEYEYLYVDKELSIDKVMAKSRRKKVASYDLNRMEILAPIASYHLDNYKNRKVKVTDYGSKKEQQSGVRYAMLYDGTQKIILEPSQELIKAIQLIAPRKVFSDGR